MMSNNNPLIILLISFLFFSSQIIISIAGEQGGPKFGYLKGTKDGPAKWARLDAKYAMCGAGKMQSPINIEDRSSVKVKSNLGQTIRLYKPAPALIINKGYAIQVNWRNDAGKIVINGSEYGLKQCHWHTPSENTVNGKRFDMELHLVHQSARYELAVVAILYNVGSSDPFLAQLVSHIKTADHKGKDIGIINPIQIGFGSSMKYYRFNGSLTTPPCTEGVLWTVIIKPKTVSKEQINALKAAVDDGFQKNARPVQPLNHRTVVAYNL